MLSVLKYPYILIKKLLQNKIKQITRKKEEFCRDLSLRNVSYLKIRKYKRVLIPMGIFYIKIFASGNSFYT